MLVPEFVASFELSAVLTPAAAESEEAIIVLLLLLVLEVLLLSLPLRGLRRYCGLFFAKDAGSVIDVTLPVRLSRSSRCSHSSTLGGRTRGEDGAERAVMEGGEDPETAPSNGDDAEGIIGSVGSGDDDADGGEAVGVEVVSDAVAARLRDFGSAALFLLPPPSSCSSSPFSSFSVLLSSLDALMAVGAVDAVGGERSWDLPAARVARCLSSASPSFVLAFLLSLSSAFFLSSSPSPSSSSLVVVLLVLLLSCFGSPRAERTAASTDILSPLVGAHRSSMFSKEK
mmetsp:Transcript_3033/g.4783  ORF Transcript_3033/g.4783 Transcript_3033/m.4783 type:complete len:285 (+) Transcript_3033:177-1031(+)